MGVAPRTAGGVKKFRIPKYYFRGAYGDNMDTKWSVVGQLVLDTTDFKRLDIGSLSYYGYESTYWFKITDDTNSKTLYYGECRDSHSAVTVNNLSYDLSNVNQVTLQAGGPAYTRERRATVTDIVLS